MAEIANWKTVGDVLKTEGNILEVGNWISKNGHKVTITPEDARILFEHIDSSLPFVILHDDGYQEPVGYATDFAENGTGIEHKGAVFNTDRVKEALTMGYTSVSPVIEYPNGNVANQKISRLALVPNPAMAHTDLNITRFAFSAPEVTSMVDTPPTNTTPEPPIPTVNIQGQQVPVNTFNTEQPRTEPASPALDPNLLANIASSIAEGVVAKFSNQLEAMQQEIATLRSADQPPAVAPPAADPEPPAGISNEWIEQLAQLRAENQAFKTQIDKEEKAAYTSKLAELRSLGQENPEKLVAHLKDTRSKIDTLDAIKVTLVKTAPMNSSQTVPLGTEGGKNSGKKPITITELAGPLVMGNIPPDELEWLSNKMKISPM
jgi:hypothetical protein